MLCDHIFKFLVQITETKFNLIVKFNIAAITLSVRSASFVLLKSDIYRGGLTCELLKERRTAPPAPNQIYLVTTHPTHRPLNGYYVQHVSNIYSSVNNIREL